MDSREYSFLQAVLGDEGAFSLKKAADRLDNLEEAIVPRAILSWLGVVARGNYEGGLPGVSDSYLDFTKNLDGTYTGSIAIGDGVFPFQNATVFHLAASVAVALGSKEVKSDGDFKDVDLVRLGKSIDLLAKAKYVAMETLAKGVPGPPHKQTQQEAPKAPIPQQKQVEKGPPVPNGQKPAKVPTEAKLPKHKIPSLKVKPKSIPVPASAAKSECTECGLKLIKNDKFVGCMCFREVAKYVSLTKSGDKYSIAFSKTLKDDDVTTILEALGVSHEQ